ncbi:SpaH/EbpB family LPXTG-anchored major pilin [Lacticaseibacillus absianus]|uniref:SpaH/EbpB family LPXTG-anchored major pilin n=1 Tax=Lacticaseibacillus absianus TaxID=2729623 RepID=UPI0015C7FCCB|nr:SpaH/EbpB family LPXTG-anchored major pilin [Lacticaseibacillus absianus]
MTKRLMKLLGGLLGLLALVVGLAQAQPVQARSTKTVEVVLHKLLFDGEMPAQQRNDGQAEPNFGEVGQPLNGVTFTAYDVSAAFWAAVAADPAHDVAAAQAKLAADTAQPRTAPVARAVTAGAGEADFAALPLHHGKHYAVYLFKETGAPAGITASQDLVVVLPGPASGKVQSRLDLFPKNRMTAGYATIDKTITNGQTSFSYGEAIPYQIQVKVPANIGALTRFVVTDTADARLARRGQLHVAIGGHALTGAYQTTLPDVHRFTLTFDPAKLIAYANQTLTITYRMQIDAGAAPDAPLVNRTTLYPGTAAPQTDTAVVLTGGKRFVKVDAKHHATTLTGATFAVRNAAGAYLVRGTDGWQWRRSGNPTHTAGLYTLRSDAQGRFAVAGLKAGAYQLVEVQPPAHYLRSRQAIPFAVVAGEYTRGQTTPYVVVNVHAPATPRRPNIWGHLPQTGGEWAAWLSLLGIILIALLTVIRVKTKQAN